MQSEYPTTCHNHIDQMIDLNRRGLTDTREARILQGTCKHEFCDILQEGVVVTKKDTTPTSDFFHLLGQITNTQIDITDPRDSLQTMMHKINAFCNTPDAPYVAAISAAIAGRQTCRKLPKIR